MFNKKNRTPLLVEVTETGWTSFGNPNNRHHKYLTKYIARRNGVSDSVQPGYYDFDIQRNGLTLDITLLPANV